MTSQVRVLPPPPSCFAPMALRRTTARQIAKQDALRSLGEGGLTHLVAICHHPYLSFSKGGQGALRLFPSKRTISGSALHRCDFRSQTADSRSQFGKVFAHVEIHSMEAC